MTRNDVIDATDREPAVNSADPVSSALQSIQDYTHELYSTTIQPFFTWSGVAELSTILFTGLAALIVSVPARLLYARLWSKPNAKVPLRSWEAIERIILPTLWVILLWFATAILHRLGIGNDVVRIVATLLSAWIVIRLISRFVPDPFYSQVFAGTVWVIAALSILNLLEPIISLLDDAAITWGDRRISAYAVLKGALLAAALLWAGTALLRLFQKRIEGAERLTPSVQVLIGQSVKLALIFAALMIALDAIGVDLTAFAVFSGAVGVGIGFGLQAIFSNMVSGIIMLVERSVKVGDFVDLQSGVTGEVKEINIRSTLVSTNDNIDILVPNSEFINGRVTNWTLRDEHKRLRIPFGVAYGSNKEHVRKAALEAAHDVPHTLLDAPDRQPQVWLANFGDSSLDFELVVWLKPEAVRRPAAVQAAYNWEIETKLHKYNIEIPFPQRDLHLRTGKLPIQLVGKD